MRIAISGLLALALSLLCALAMVSGSNATPAAPSSIGMSMPHTATGLAPSETAGPVMATSRVDVGTPDMLGGRCTGVCASHSAAGCALAVVLAVVSLLGLLLSQRRNTYLGVTARPRPRRLSRQNERARPPRWAVLTLTDLCVLRV